MAYVTSAMIVARLGQDRAVQLTTDSGTSVDTAMIDAAITRVEGRINAAVRTRTSEVITEAVYPATFAMLQGLVLDMTVYHLAARRPPVPDDWKEANTEALEWLKLLAKGEVGLPDVGMGGAEFEWGSDDQNAATTREL
ncbi:MAG TPA: phage protein Gp36 family protein [Planctomycetota bacterium]|nr:phage protein Gp36 family protein [Acidobacteriota bacterium]HUW30521.1 phage protein Gp36 family protein [Planctomycetota bacterium]